MEDLKKLSEKLRGLLETMFSGSSVELEDPSPKVRIGATIVWNEFIGKDQLERQNMVWEVIDRNFEPSEARHISLIMTLTPDELAAIQES